jgi:hypothetical protein
MTEQNQKILYDHFIKTGQIERAKAISDIPRYSKFVEPVPKEESKSK